MVLEHNGFTLAVIDTPPTNNDVSAYAIAAADICLIPARPSPADIEAALPTLSVVRKLRKPFAFVLSQTQPRGLRVTEAAAALNAAGILALPISSNATTIRMPSARVLPSPSSLRGRGRAWDCRPVAMDLG